MQKGLIKIDKTNRNRLILRLVIYFSAIVAALLYLGLVRGNGCVFYNLFKKPCLSCGMTRALLAVLRGDFQSAIYLHPIFTLALLPVGAIIAIQDFAAVIISVITGKTQESMLEFLFRRKQYVYNEKGE